MPEISFHANGNDQLHECESFREGDWITFHCPLCPDFQRRLNWRTGESTVKNGSMEIRHVGTYFPKEYRSAFENLN